MCRANRVKQSLLVLFPTLDGGRPGCEDAKVR